MSRIESIQPKADGTYEVQFWLTRDEAVKTSALVHEWAEGTRVAAGWKQTYKNLGIAVEAAKKSRPDLASKLQSQGSAKGAIWNIDSREEDWKVEVLIRGDILLDFAAVLKMENFLEEAQQIEQAVGEEVPAYPQDPENWADHFWKVLTPLYRRRFGSYRWSAS